MLLKLASCQDRFIMGAPTSLFYRNQGHDLSLDNIKFFAQNIPQLLEVSIGHALVCESLYLGFENVIPMYLQRLAQ